MSKLKNSSKAVKKCKNWLENGIRNAANIQLFLHNSNSKMHQEMQQNCIKNAAKKQQKMLQK